MALDNPEHGIIISATKDRYNMPELKRASAQLWDSQLKRLRAKCSDANLGRMLRLEELSKDFMDYEVVLYIHTYPSSIPRA